MLAQSKGIVLHHLKYTGSSVIVKIYTENNGLRSYILKGVTRKSNKNKLSTLQPLSIVEIVAYERNKGGLQMLKEIRLHQPYSTIPFNITKSSIALFITEILYKSLKEEMPDPALFAFLTNAFEILDLDDDCLNFHLCFMMQLSRYFGFYPQEQGDRAIFFDLREGIFMRIRPKHEEFLEPIETSLFSDVLGTNFDGIKRLKISNQQRRELLNSLILYFRLHLDSMKEIKSHEILETVLTD
jgi:DNA repair protein RecO (recombination protein O)